MADFYERRVRIEKDGVSGAGTMDSDGYITNTKADRVVVHAELIFRKHNYKRLSNESIPATQSTPGARSEQKQVFISYDPEYLQHWETIREGMYIVILSAFEFGTEYKITAVRPYETSIQIDAVRVDIASPGEKPLSKYTTYSKVAAVDIPIISARMRQWLKEFEYRAQGAGEMLAHEWEELAQNDHPWVTRTGNTEENTAGEWNYQNGKLSIIVSVDRDYAEFLEFAKGGRWAWLARTLDYMRPRIIDTLYDELG